MDILNEIVDLILDYIPWFDTYVYVKVANLKNPFVVTKS